MRLDVVVRWRHGLPAKRDEPGFPTADPEGSAAALTNPHARRTSVGELFRDGRDGRYGLGLGQARVTATGRPDRSVLALAFAIVLSTGLGRVARGRSRPGAWCGSNDPNECGDVTAGRGMRDVIAAPPERLLGEVVRATLLAGGNWG